VMLLQLAFGAIFMVVEGWDFGTALYHCLITATTCGFGDVPITSEAGQILAFVHIAVSVSLLGAIINEIGAVMEERTYLLNRHELFIAKMDPDVWSSVLQGQESKEFDRADFICAMLIRLELVDKSDIEVLTKLWERLDKGRAGIVNRNELASIAQTYRSRNTIVLTHSMARPSLASSILTTIGRTKTCSRGQSGEAGSTAQMEIVNPAGRASSVTSVKFALPEREELSVSTVEPKL